MRRATLKDVAERAGVSFQTVSKVLNDRGTVSSATEARIWEAVQALHYRPNMMARNLRQLSSNLIGLALSPAEQDDGFAQNSSWYYQLAAAAEANHYSLLTFATPLQVDSIHYQQLFARGQVAGFIVPLTHTEATLIESLQEKKIPFVVYGNGESSNRYNWTGVDRAYGVQLIVEYLLKQGHRRIALLGHAAAERASYELCLQRAGITLRCILNDLAELKSALQQEARQRPTAIICATDVMAVQVLQMASEAGLEEVAVSGYGDTWLAQSTRPRFITLRPPLAEMAQTLVELLIQQITNRGNGNRGILLRPRLIIPEPQ